MQVNNQQSPHYYWPNGWLLLDKPYGVSSHDALRPIKHALRKIHPDAKSKELPKVGHAGTLDPLATGLLPVAIGDATRLIPYIQNTRKQYQFTIRFGQERSTDDAEGEIINESPNRPNNEQIKQVIAKFIGDIAQTPPIYSAIKSNGKRAYQLARQGTQVELEKRNITIYSLTLDKHHDDDFASFSVECSKGTYIRSLARDIGRELGCYGYVSNLRRIEVGKLSLDKKNINNNYQNSVIFLDNQHKNIHKCNDKFANRLEDFNQSFKRNDSNNLQIPYEGNDDIISKILPKILPIHIVLDDISVLYAKNLAIIDSLQTGKLVHIDSFDVNDEFILQNDQIYQVHFYDKLVALVKIVDCKIQPIKVFIRVINEIYATKL